MLKSYFNIAYRNLVKNKVFSFINIFGLAIGMAACLLILQYVRFELSYDDFHEKGDDIYQVSMEYQSGGQAAQHFGTNFFPTGPTIRDEYPEIIDFTRIVSITDQSIVEVDENQFQESDYYFADSSLLSMFSFPLLRGNLKTALREPNSVVLVRSVAEKYFGENWEDQQDILGRIIELKEGDQELTLKITGVMEDVPGNSSMQFSLLISMPTFEKAQGEGLRDNWGWTIFFTFEELAPEADPRLLESKFPELIAKYKGEYHTNQGVREDFFLHQLQDIHLHTQLLGELSPGGNYQTVYILGIIAILILLIAWINYVNLSISISIERVKEVGIRKVTGAKRRQIVSQFLLESFLLNVIAIALAFSFVQIALPIFQDIIGRPLPLLLFQSYFFWIVLLVILSLGSLLSGLYPALMVSGYSPIQVFRNNKRNKSSGHNLKKALNIFQFAASVSLIAFTITIFMQVRYMQNQDLGMNLDQTMVIRAPIITSEDSVYQQKADYLKNELLQQTTIQRVSTSWFIPGGDGLSGWGGYIRRVGSEHIDVKNYLRGGIDYDFIDLYEMEILAGRNFSEDYASDKEAVILTEEAMYDLGFKDPASAIGQYILYPINRQQDNKSIEVIGVVKNFHQQSLQSGFLSIIFHLAPSSGSYFSLRVSSQDIQQTVAYANDVWNEAFPESSFNYFFANEFFNNQYQADLKYGTIFGIFTLLAIFIASLGLFGLSAFTIKQRIKEIGIRKVLGASVRNIVLLLSRDYIKLIIVSNIIAIPFTYLLVQQWLSDYAFKINVGWWIFLLPMLIVLLIALFSISFQTIRAALTNPVDSLRYE
ncbi:MAG: ABC transporter permease [Cyclobacteriaceae bacterium]